MTIDCDVIVVGMGTCGEDAALRLAAAGLDVVGIEPNLIGGECPYWACLPTKSMVRSANLLTEARRADGLIGLVHVNSDWSRVAERIRAEITGGWDDSAGVKRFEAKGGRFLRGWGRLTAPYTVLVDDTTVVASTGVVIATGSTPLIPPIPGLEDTAYWTNREAVATEELPRSLAVIGGGPVGCELAQVFARFGSEVTIVEGADRILGHNEPEAAAVVATVLADDGIQLRTGVKVIAVRSGDDGFEIELSDGSQVSAERLLVATGRRANAEGLGIESAGAVVEGGAVQVDGLMRAGEGLWAIGDVTGQSMLTQVAEYQGRIAIEDILGGKPRPADYSAMPAVTFTDPELASVGLTESEARATGNEITVVVKDIQATFRGWLHRTGNKGLIKLVADRDENRLVGATVVGPSAGETIGFLHVAVAQQVPLEELVDLIYPFPTFYGGIGEALGAYGRGIVRVLDPATPPLFEDPKLIN